MTTVFKYNYLVNPANTIDSNGNLTVYSFGSGATATNVDIFDEDNAIFLFRALAEWERVANVDFQFDLTVTSQTQGWLFGSGELTGAFGKNQKINPDGSSGVIIIGERDSLMPTLEYGLGFETLLHEIGHIFSADISFFGGIHPSQSSTQTVMTAEYNQPFVLTPSILDIQAIQAVYGASSNNSGNTSYSVNGISITDGTVSWQAGAGETYVTIWDAGGTDTINLSGYTGSANGHIDLREGFDNNGDQYYSKIGDTHLYIAYNSQVENAIGSNNADEIIGNNEQNFLEGGSGDDELFGGGNNDTLDGGANNDELTGGSGADFFIVGSGHDEILDLSASDQVIWYTGSASLVVDGEGKYESGNDWSFNISGQIFKGTVSGADLILHRMADGASTANDVILRGIITDGETDAPQTGGAGGITLEAKVDEEREEMNENAQEAYRAFQEAMGCDAPFFYARGLQYLPTWF